MIPKRDPEQFHLAKRAVTALRFDDDEFRTKAMKAELEELAAAADHARHVLENGDPECEAAMEALETGWKDMKR